MVEDYAIIGSSSQALSCDNRHCDNRKGVAYEIMAGRGPIQPEAIEIFRRLDALGLKQRDLARAIDIEENKVSKAKAGDRMFKAGEVIRAGEWLTEMEASQQSAPTAIHPDLAPTRLAAADDDTVEIMQLDLSFSMGTGTTIDDYIEQTPVRFDLDYIRAFTRTPPHRLRLARGVGESMFPTLASSDLVWIDTTQTVLNQQDRIWAISLYGAAAIKRLRTIGSGKVLVMSDNPAVGHQEVEAEDLVIGGRVIRFARDL